MLKFVLNFLNNCLGEIVIIYHLTLIEVMELVYSKSAHNIFAGQGKGFNIDLVKLISDSVSIPVIASSGAGSVDHFSEVFSQTNASAALAAGIFHRKEV